MAVLGAVVDGWKFHGRACPYCFFEVDRHNVVELHPSYLLQFSCSFEDNLMSHVADHRVRPHESLPNSTQKTDPPLLKILVLIELEDLVLHPRPNKILREASDAVRNTRVIRVVGFINEVEGLGHVFHDK